MNRRWQYAFVVATVLITAASARGQDVHLQMEQVHDLAKQMFGLPVVYAVPTTPCPDPCPCAQKCTCGTNCTCDNLTGTVNKKLVGRVWYWGWTLRNLPANSPTRACARQYVLDHLNLQQQYGHYTLAADGGEVLTISHGQIYLAGMAAAYLFALTNGPTYGAAGSTPDQQMLDAVKKWWADEKYVWDQVANGSGQIRAPGARFLVPGPPNEGEWTYREQVYALLKGQVPSGISNWSTDKYFTGGWIIDELRRRGHSPSNIITPPAGYVATGRIPETLCLYRRGADYVNYFPQLRNVLNPLFWVRKEGGTTTYAVPIPSGAPTFPATKPANFPGATKIQITGLVPGSVQCPAADALQQ